MLQEGHSTRKKEARYDTIQYRYRCFIVGDVLEFLSTSTQSLTYVRQMSKYLTSRKQMQVLAEHPEHKDDLSKGQRCIVVAVNRSDKTTLLISPIAPFSLDLPSENCAFPSLPSQA